MAKEMLMKNKDDIIKLYISGLTQQQIADKYNTSKSSIARFLRSVDITSKVIITEFDELQIIELYSNGMIIRDIANKFNIGDRRVSDILKKYNIQILQSYERRQKYSLNEDVFGVRVLLLHGGHRHYDDGAVVYEKKITLLCHKLVPVRIYISSNVGTGV